MAKIYIFEGTCDVCGGALRMEYDPLSGVVDTWVEEDGTWGTWIRHIANKDVNPDCDRYSSRVKFIKEE